MYVALCHLLGENGKYIQLGCVYYLFLVIGIKPKPSSGCVLIDPNFRYSSVPNFRYDSVPNFRYDSVPIFRYDSVPNFRYDSVPNFRYDSVPNFRYDVVPNFRYTSVPNFRYEFFTHPGVFAFTPTIIGKNANTPGRVCSYSYL